MMQVFAADRVIERIQKTLEGADQVRALAYGLFLPIYIARPVLLCKGRILRILAVGARCSIRDSGLKSALRRGLNHGLLRGTWTKPLPRQWRLLQG